jgi:hypothetical protein
VNEAGGAGTNTVSGGRDSASGEWLVKHDTGDERRVEPSHGVCGDREGTGLERQPGGLRGRRRRSESGGPSGDTLMSVSDISVSGRVLCDAIVMSVARRENDAGDAAVCVLQGTKE